MPNARYSSGSEGFLDGTINWSTGDIRAMLVKSTYVYNAAHKFISDLGDVVNGRSLALTGKTATAGVADATDSALEARDAAASNAIILFQHTGVDTTARLIAYIDTPTTGLPFTPAVNQTLNLIWDNGANRIFKL